MVGNKTPKSNVRNPKVYVGNWKSEAGNKKILRLWSEIKLRTPESNVRRPEGEKLKVGSLK